MEQCREEIDMNWDVFSWEHHREFLYPSFTLQVALQFCFSSWLGQGEGMGHHRVGLAVPTALSQPNTSAHFLCTGLRNLLSGKASPQVQSWTETLEFSFPIQWKILSTFASPESSCTAHLLLLNNWSRTSSLSSQSIISSCWPSFIVLFWILSSFSAAF